MVELNDQSLRSDPETAVRSLLSSLHYEEYLYESAISPKAAEMQSKNVATLFSWVEDMLKGDEVNEQMTLNQDVYKRQIIPGVLLYLVGSLRPPMNSTGCMSLILKAFCSTGVTPSLSPAVRPVMK